MPAPPRSAGIAASYDAAARGYAEHFATELAGKPLDRHLLERFAEATRGHGRVADLGCGPGHIGRYVHDRGVETVGIDLSPGMIDVARALNPALEFVVGDMRDLELPDGGLAGAIAFYAIVHFACSELEAVFAEVCRVLAPGAPVLVAFHVGDQITHVDELFGAPVALDFRFHPPGAVVTALAAAGLPVLEHCEREPYPGVEHPSRRCYLLARRRA